MVQATPFCNINCDYCYLPDRDSTARLAPDTFELLLRRVVASGLVGRELSIVWHAGEPLALPIAYYATLFERITAVKELGGRVRHSIQTNGIPLSDAWCDFIAMHRIGVGVSVDGPAFIHDAHRRDRQGRGTHDRVVKGIECLQRRGIDFHVIAVVTADAVDHPDDVFNFFLELGVRRLGFNVEEIEGVHGDSSLHDETVARRMRAFWSRMCELQRQHAGQIRIRELDRARHAILNSPLTVTVEDVMRSRSEVAPFAIVSSDWRGNLSSFSPELLGMTHPRFGDFFFGNVAEGELLDLRHAAVFNAVASEIEAGVSMCRSTCQYFAFCGGGAPSNKLAENGTFASTETMHCRTSIQMPIDVVLAEMEARLTQ